MWFNNRFNNNGTIHFEMSEWTCTDPNECQFCRKISDTEFEYIQLRNKALLNGKSYGKNALLALNDNTKINDWYEDEIDVNNYTDREKEEYLAPYGGILDGWEKDADRNQLVAECIFETDGVYDFYFG